MKLSARAPAKINRELRVGRIRPDGFHEIRSRMTSISLADTLTVEDADGLELSCSAPEVPAGDDNIVVRAATLLAREAGIEPRARIHLEKRVPMGGGLGGGSADAAIALRLLASLWKISGDAKDLANVAAVLGSDVPFFLTGGEANVTGRGEVVTPVEDSASVEILLFVPPFPISTAAVYRDHAGRFALPEKLEIESPGSEKFLGPNDLASAVLRMEPRMEAYVESAARITRDHLISGSGATIVLHAPPPGAAAALAARHPEAGVYPCRTLTRAEFQQATSPSPRGGHP
ncbi:MAG: 4-(cytidine 5'-diphospho)-2-C-methyl-D-erythritol kinase [Thermoanaerobaculia bacterium]